MITLKRVSNVVFFTIAFKTMVTVLEITSLPQKLDPDRIFQRSYKQWTAQTEKTYIHLPTHEEFNATGEGKSAEFTTQTWPDGRMKISQRHVFDMVLLKHSELNYTTDAHLICVELAKVTPDIHTDMISDIIAWSVPSMKLDSIFRLAIQQPHPRFPLARALDIKKLMVWEKVHSFQRSSSLNKPPKITPIVFFGLVYLEDTHYSILFLEAHTQSYQFSEAFSCSEHNDFVNLLADLLVTFVQRHGYPPSMMCFNPTTGRSKWLFDTWQRAIFKSGLKGIRFGVLNLTKHKYMFPQILIMAFNCVFKELFDERDDTKSKPPFDVWDSSSSWELFYVKYSELSQSRIFLCHPNVPGPFASNLLHLVNYLAPYKRVDELIWHRLDVEFPKERRVNDDCSAECSNESC